MAKPTDTRKFLYRFLILCFVFSAFQLDGDAEDSAECLSEIEIGSKHNANVMVTQDTPVTAASELNLTNTTFIPPHLQDCGIWVAMSAIEGAGLGMYAGRDYAKGDNLQDFGDLIVPIVDKSLHNQEQEFPFMWEDYHWNGWIVGTDVEAYELGDGASPGFGSTANSFLPVVNVEEGYPKKDNEGLHRSKDPGAGAFTEYYNRQNKATRDIAGGEEFYVNYGSHWFKERPYLGPVPLKLDLKRATHLFKAFRGLQNATNSVPSLVFDDLWDTFIRNTQFASSRVFGSFRHDNQEELTELEKVGSLRELRLNQAKKSPEWFYDYGTCGDHIYGAPSTIQQAGRGAFAKRDLPEGTVVAPVPLLHITNRSRLDMYYFENGPRSRLAGPRPPQLLLNYCYGHPESTLLLSPYGPVVNYVNHNQTLANIRLKWADPVRSNFDPSLLDEPLETLEKEQSAKLALEFVATKTILKDEEVFLDYGDAWEQAWQAHVQAWEPEEGAQDYVTKEEYETSQEHLPWQTAFELMDNPFPPNVMLQSNYIFLLTDDWEDMTEEEIHEEIDNEDYDWFECEITRRYGDKDNGYLFAAINLEYDAEPWNELTDLPHFAFRMRERPYTSDMFLPNAFRHEIHIPDEMFPQAWRNARRSE